MGTRDPRIDAYIVRSADFARPILEQLRETVHAACPEVEETMKWSMPHFMYGGGILCGMASFKAHCTFGFWQGAAILGDAARSGEAMGQLGRITSPRDLPSKKVLTGWIRSAMALRDGGAKTPAARRRPAPRKELAAPDWFMAALKKNPRALATFQAFSPSARREYVEWVTEAKGEETRAKRLATAVEWMAAGKKRNWKYETTRPAARSAGGTRRA